MLPWFLSPEALCSQPEALGAMVASRTFFHPSTWLLEKVAGPGDTFSRECLD